MGDENPICTLGDYFKPIHEGYRNTTELPVGNNVLQIDILTYRVRCGALGIGNTGVWISLACLLFDCLEDQLKGSNEQPESTFNEYLTKVRDDNGPGVVRPLFEENIKFEFWGQCIDELKDNVFLGNNDKTPSNTSQISHLLSTSSNLLEYQATRYHPLSQIIRQTKAIRNFGQECNEPLHLAWERFNDLLYNCPEHKINEHEQLQIFYQGLDPETRKKSDFMGPIPRMTPAAGIKAIDELSKHSLSLSCIKKRNTRKMILTRTPNDERDSLLEETVSSFIKEAHWMQKNNENFVWRIKRNYDRTFKNQASAIKTIEKYLCRILESIHGRGGKGSEAFKIILNEQCSAVILNKVPPKEKDPGGFTIPCVILQSRITKALADLGASISLMPYSMFLQLNLCDLKPTRMCIKLANKTTQFPKGIAKNVLVKIDKFVFPVNFVILDMEEDHRIPIILGRPFLATTHAMIDVFNKKISFKVGDAIITFDLEKSIRFPPSDEDTCHSADIILSVVENIKEILPQNHDNLIEPILDHPPAIHEDCNNLALFAANSIDEEKPTPKLKELPSHLEYAFLDNNRELSVIISSLSSDQEKRKLNDATRKDHFPLPFIDQMLERLSGNEYYCFLDGFSGYFQIPLAPKDQEKTTFTFEESLNVTFDETPPPPKTSPLEDDDLIEEQAIEVFGNKLDENGVVSRNKARIVAQGYNQQEGIDYDETYAPVARLESIRILLTFACALDFKLFQIDVKSAFLNGFINEKVYVAQHPGFIDFAKPNHVYKLKKALYGLKQAPKAWYDILKAFLIKHDYTMRMVDNTIFTIKKDPNLIIVQIYIDDIILGLTCQEMCDDFAKIMHDEFEMSMMEELNFLLGLRIKQLEDGIFFNQSKYIKEMLKKFGLEDSKPMKTPISTETKLTKDVEGESVYNTKYRGMIGSLLYLTASRPDIMFSVCLCARFQEDPKISHLEAVKRISRYVKGTMHLGLCYPKGSDIETIVYADSDHAGDYVNRKSTSGICTFMRCCLTSWFSKKQIALAISTTEAEYVSAKKACQQALWMKQALIDYGIRLDDIPIMCDNKGAIDLSKNPVQHSRTKHIEIRHHFLRDNVQKGNISIKKVSSEDNIADILTKPLKREPFNYLRLRMMEQID
ncbi:retrovirus-related pol polyprotein from transposon TNT 1-94 [Tanacetum coccineum]